MSAGGVIGVMTMCLNGFTNFNSCRSHLLATDLSFHFSFEWNLTCQSLKAVLNQNLFNTKIKVLKKKAMCYNNANVRQNVTRL